MGAFGACARALGESGLEPAARAAVGAGVPFFGVCVGFQLLYEGSEENPGVAGLGVFPGTVALLPAGVKHPQMQWNQLTPCRDGADGGNGAVPVGPLRGWGAALGLLRALLRAAGRPRDGGGLRLRRAGGRGGGRDPCGAPSSTRRSPDGAGWPCWPTSSPWRRDRGGRDRAVMELYPAIDLRGGGAVRLTQGDFAREEDYGDPLALAASFVAAGAPWLHVVDLDAARTGVPHERATLARIVELADGRSGCRPAVASAVPRTWKACSRWVSTGWSWAPPRWRTRRSPPAAPAAGRAGWRSGWTTWWARTA